MTNVSKVRSPRPSMQIQRALNFIAVEPRVIGVRHEGIPEGEENCLKPRFPVVHTISI